MAQTRAPSLFISHGAPTFVIEPSPARDFLGGLGARLGRPKAIVAISAHYETDRVHVSTAARPEMIYDFRGFPEPLYSIQYPAPGAPDLAERIAGMVEQAGLDVAREDRGFDHGTWTPLVLMYPDADIPVVTVSISPAMGFAHHVQLGELLRPLRDEGVMILGSGGSTHNVRYLIDMSNAGQSEPGWMARFRHWLGQAVAQRDTQALAAFRSQAPDAAQNHPTDDHYLPLLVTVGAAFPDEPLAQYDPLSAKPAVPMDIYVFGEAADSARTAA